MGLETWQKIFPEQNTFGTLDNLELKKLDWLGNEIGREGLFL